MHTKVIFTLRAILTLLLVCVAMRGAVGVEASSAFVGQVAFPDGHQANFDDVEVTLIGRTVVLTAAVGSDGIFRFTGLVVGEYQIQFNKPGYRSPATYSFTVDDDGIISSGSRTFLLEPLPSDLWVFHWQTDSTESGQEYTSQANAIQPIQVSFLDDGESLADSSASIRLLHDYNVVLVNEAGNHWSTEHASRFLIVMDAIPQRTRNPYHIQSLPASRWYIANDHIANDLEITTQPDDVRMVRIAAAAFVNAAPKLVEIEGKRGHFFSQRLHHALVRYVTDNGNDVSAYEKILRDRYGVTTQIDSYADLTASTTGEGDSRFQRFHPEEIVQIINMLEEMPSGMHKIDGLRFFARRMDGNPHPLYPQAAAVAWPDVGYIEFMESAFSSTSIDHTHRLILHEKAHFLWEHTFPASLKQAWVELGEWYQTDSGEWWTKQQTQFVNSYAHGINPNEDMAESIAYFILNPDKLRSVAPEKYEFIRDRIMHGNIYISQIRPDLTFEVFNLWPDYIFPGKIKRIDIEVRGLPEEDKEVRVEIELHSQADTHQGATNAYMRIFNELGSYVDLYLYPSNDSGTILSNNFTVSRYAKAGYWAPTQISLTDAVGNKRYEGTGDFSWTLYINNPLERVEAPKYVPNSIQMSVMPGEDDVQIIEVSWKVAADPAMMRRQQPCYVRMNDEHRTTYSFDEYGHYDEETGRCVVQFLMPPYMPDGMYTTVYIVMEDIARNESRVYFRDPGYALRQEDTVVDEDGPQVRLTTANPDIEGPEVNVNKIYVQARPTNPRLPDGETYVTITFDVRDNIAGFEHGAVYLRDPQGKEHYYYVYHNSYGDPYSYSVPTEWETFTHTIILPRGSAPGIWGLTSLRVDDRAENERHYDFTEVMHFVVRDAESERQASKPKVSVAAASSMPDILTLECPTWQSHLICR